VRPISCLDGYDTRSRLENISLQSEPGGKDPNFYAFCYEVEWDTYNAFADRRSYWYELLRRDIRVERQREVDRDKEKPFFRPDDSLLTLVLNVIGFIIGLGIIMGSNPFNIWQYRRLDFLQEQVRICFDNMAQFVTRVFTLATPGSAIPSMLKNAK
jgi:hypothetical protein